jgi:hypothetical protein
MGSGDDQRTFVQYEDGSPTKEFTNRWPRGAALKAARRLDAAATERKARIDPTKVYIREDGANEIHVYDGWAWTTDPGEDAPDFLPDTVTEANVSKQGVVDVSEVVDPDGPVGAEDNDSSDSDTKVYVPSGNRTDRNDRGRGTNDTAGGADVTDTRVYSPGGNNGRAGSRSNPAQAAGGNSDTGPDAERTAGEGRREPNSRPREVRYCRHCGADVRDYDDPSYCPSCGGSLVT